MESWGVSFLGVIALSSLVQTAFLVGLIVAGRRLGRRIDELQKRVDQDIRPGLENLTRVTRNLAEISDVAARETQRIAEVVGSTLDRLEETAQLVQRFVLKPLAPLADAIALLKGLRRGVEVFKRLGEADRERRGGVRRYHDDEHLFI
jgi:hypothetical protein